MKTFNRVELAAVVLMMAATACGPGGNEECPQVACMLACERFQQDANGCDVCACDDGSTSSSSSSSGQASSSSSSGQVSSSSSSGGVCPELECPLAIWCPYGMEVDANGCGTCGCAAAPCADITDEGACRAQEGCVPVYFSEDGRPVGDHATFPAARMQCCVDGPNGVDCGEPAPSCFGAWTDEVGNCRGPADGILPAECCPRVTACWSDRDCAAFERCDTENFCESACPPNGDPDQACPAVCLGRCVPAEEPAGCFSDEQCAPGQRCDTQNYCDSACSDPSAPCPDVCVGRCVPAEDPCAVVRCGGGDVCVACQPWEDCNAKCVTPEPPPACAAVLCAAGTQCVECLPTEDCVVKCVVVEEPVDCRVNGCAGGESCQEITACSGGAACTCAAGDANCECPPYNGDDACFLQFVCMPAPVTDEC